MRLNFSFLEGSCSFQTSNVIRPNFSEFHRIFLNFLKIDRIDHLWIFCSARIFKHWSGLTRWRIGAVTRGALDKIFSLTRWRTGQGYFGLCRWLISIKDQAVAKEPFRDCYNAIVVEISFREAQCWECYNQNKLSGFRIIIPSCSSV
jgi:hypothetical protein